MAAISTNCIFEVRSTAGIDRGGGFDATVAVPGTDYSQQDAIQKTYTDLVIDATDNTKATSVLVGFTAADVGNVYNVTGGTGFTVQRIVLIAVTGGTPSTAVGTFNFSLGTTTSIGGAAKMGGAVSALTTHASAQVPGNITYVKATATYPISATQTFSVAGTAGNPITYIGYTTTRTDNGQVTVQRSSGTTVNVFSITGALRRFYNFIADCNTNGTTIKGFLITGNNCIISNCKAINFVTSGFETGVGNNDIFMNCYATGGITGATAGFNIASTGIGMLLMSCISATNACPGFINSASGTGRNSFLRCIAANNTVAGSDGFRQSNTSQILLNNCISYGNAGAGFLISGATGDGSVITNSIFINNGTYGINSDTTNYTTSGKYQLLLNYNACYNNTTAARNNVAVGDNDVTTLTGDPFTNGATLDFSLNNVALQGAVLRAVGFPGTPQAGGTGYLDIGVMQHADPASSSGGGASIIQI